MEQDSGVPVTEIVPVTEQVRNLVWGLAEAEAPLDGETGACLLCDMQIPLEEITFQRHGTDGRTYGEVECDHRAHKADCPWRMAREVVGVPLNRVEAHERERLDLPESVTEFRFLRDGHQPEPFPPPPREIRWMRGGQQMRTVPEDLSEETLDGQRDFFRRWGFEHGDHDIIVRDGDREWPLFPHGEPSLPPEPTE